MLLRIAPLVVFLAACSDLPKAEGISIAGVVGDAVTSKVAFDKGYSEGNPLLGKHPSTGAIVGLGALKIAAIEASTLLPPDLHRAVFSSVAAVEFGVTANNVAVFSHNRSMEPAWILGVVFPVWWLTWSVDE